MLTKLVAEMSEPDRADLMQRRERPLRVPPVVGELSEAGDFIAVDCGGFLRQSHRRHWWPAFIACQGSLSHVATTGPKQYEGPRISGWSKIKGRPSCC